MLRCTLVTLLLLALIPTAVADTFTVTKVWNGGIGSLRWAINQANSNPGPDRILFSAALTGRTIRPTAELPALTDDDTAIIGDIDGDGDPDIRLDGAAVTEPGLTVRGNECTIAGLSIVKFKAQGIFIDDANDCFIRSCHVGVNLPGKKMERNGASQIRLERAHRNIIGGWGAGGNVIAAGSRSSDHAGVRIVNGLYNEVRNNNIGVARDGVTPLSSTSESWAGIQLQLVALPEPPAPSTDHPALPPGDYCTYNRIGGPNARDRNVIGGMYTGIHLDNADVNKIQGNYIGLGRDGDTQIDISRAGIIANRGSSRNVIGGTESGERNIFAAAPSGIIFRGADTINNKVQGNWFGVNATGTAQTDLRSGVLVYLNAGPQMIGGGTTRAGNVFCPKAKTSSSDAIGVLLVEDASGTTIRNNTFGVRPDGANSSKATEAVKLDSVSADVTGNIIARAVRGVQCYRTVQPTRICKNRFRGCDYGVIIGSGGRAVLGNLNNSSSKDDGENRFFSSNTWHIYNATPYRVMAENSNFGTRRRSEINAKIYDRRDNPAYGRVDFDPLFGGASPTGDGEILVLTAAAVSTAAGAEITFNLSSAADVTVDVLNIAGRRVATIAQGLPSDAGMQRLAWSGRSDGGTAAPNGRYIVRIIARNADGQQAQAVCAMALGR